MRHQQASAVIFTNLLIENTENIGKPDRQKQMNTIRSPWMYNSSNSNGVSSESLLDNSS